MCIYRDIFRFTNSSLTIILINLCVVSVLLYISHNYLITVTLLILLISLIPYMTYFVGDRALTVVHIIGIAFRVTYIYNTLNYRYYTLLPVRPAVIRPLLVIIEILRRFIKPIRLLLRITINLGVGHIIMYILPPLLSLPYNIIELFIVMIQVYIFYTLLSIYRKCL